MGSEQNEIMVGAAGGRFGVLACIHAMPRLQLHFPQSASTTGLATRTGASWPLKRME